MTRKPLRPLIYLAASILAPAALQAQATRIDLPSDYVPGYARTLEGEELRYHSPLPYVESSLLVRSLSRERSIAWQTAPVPESFAGDTAVFVIMAGIDVHERPRRFDLFLQSEPVLSFENPSAAAAGDTIVWTGAAGVRAEFRVTLIDKYGDAMGFIFLSVPRALWGESRTLRLDVAGESAGVPTWFMIFKEPVAPHITLQNAPALLRGEPGDRQIVRVDLLYLGDAGHVRMASPIGTIDTALALGNSRFQIPVPAVEGPTPFELEFQVDELSARDTFTVQPVRRLDLYLVHHTHLDIGYTHHQDEVERLQWQHLEDALRYGAASQDYPEGARFVWNPEALWAVESYLEEHGRSERERLVEGVRRGWIALDALTANLLTGLATSEGLTHGLDAYRRLNQRYGFVTESAMLSDIPGFTWGLVPVLAGHGVRYLSIGPNFGHRIGHFSDAWGDRPFYWESPSGKERVLTWVAGAGYAWFHSGLGYSKITKALDEEQVFKYLNRLVEEAYPYGIAHMRYNIGSDNGPPDPDLADAVRAWNEKYVSPRLLISSTTELFREFERRYGAGLPTYRGDLTGHWEDGAASSARETALVRRTAESLVQTEALAALLGIVLPADELYRAWRNVVLYYEHTWGSWNSVSEPTSEFTLSQWRRKREFAEEAAAGAARLRAAAVAGRAAGPVTARVIDVYNTLSWLRNDVVVLAAEHSGVGDRVLDESGAPVPSQRLSTGELAFRAADVPAFGSRRYTLVPGAAWSEGAVEAGGQTIWNGTVSVSVDRLRGTIASLRYRGRELVGIGSGGLNRYIYVAGRSPEDTATAGPARVRLKERGPLVGSIEWEAEAPGTRTGVQSEIRIYDGLKRVDIVNGIDKARVYEPEAVLYEFPFAIAEPEVRVDVPWGSYRLDEEQLPGASRNYMSLERWVDIHGREAGVTFVSVDVPLVQFGAIRTDAIVTGWLEHIEPSATILAYPMNNYWETNYRAVQEGPHEFRFSVRPYEASSEAEAERFAREVAQPLIAVPVRAEAPPLQPPLAVDARYTVVTTLRLAEDGDVLMLRLYNPGPVEDVVRLEWPSGGRPTVYASDFWERALEPQPGEVRLGPHEMLTLRIEK